MLQNIFFGKNIVQATHEGTINIKNNLTPEASQVLVFPNLTNESLVSIGQLCDNGCIVLFTKKYAYICKEKKLVATGYRNPFDGLWDLRANANITQQSMSNNIKNINYIIKKDKTKHDLTAYYHASLFS